MEDLDFDFNVQIDEANDIINGIDMDSVNTEDESSSSEESSYGIEDNKRLDDHIDQLTTEMVVDISEKAGAIVDKDTASELKTTVMNRLRYVLMVAMQFSHHENSAGLGCRDFEKAEEAVLDSSSTRKMFSPDKESEKTIDLFKSVSHEKFNELPFENLNPRIKVQCPNYYHYLPTDDEQDCEDCILNNACFEETDQFLVPEENLKFLSSSDEVECDDSEEQLEQELNEISDENEINIIEDEINDETTFKDENEHLHNVECEVAKEYTETNPQLNSESEIVGEPIQDYCNTNVSESIEESQENGVEGAMMTEIEDKFISVNEEGYAIEENPDNFTEQLIATEPDLNDSSSSTNRYLVHEYVDDEGNSYLVTQDSTIANSEGFISDSILTETKPDCDFENGQRVFEYTEEGMQVETEEGYIAAVTVEEPSGHEGGCEIRLNDIAAPWIKLTDEVVDTIDTAKEGSIEEIELENSDQEIEFLEVDRETDITLPYPYKVNEIELKIFEEGGEPIHNDEVEYSKKKVNLKNPHYIDWTEEENEQAIELKITDDKKLWNSKTQILKSYGVPEISYQLSDTERELNDSDETESSGDDTSEIISDNDEQDRLNFSKLHSRKSHDEFVEYVAVDVMVINNDENVDKSQRDFDYHEYFDGEIFFDSSSTNFPKTLTSNEDSDMEMKMVNLDDLANARSIAMEKVKDVQEPILTKNENEMSDKWLLDGQNEDNDISISEISKLEKPLLLPNMMEFYDYMDDDIDPEDVTDMKPRHDRVLFTKIPEFDIVFNYRDASSFSHSTANGQLEFPDTEIELVDSEGQAEVSDSDAEVLLEDEYVSAESDDSNPSVEGEDSVSDSSEITSAEDSVSDTEITNDFALNTSIKVDRAEPKGNEYAQVQDFVVIENANASEISEYRIHFETLKLNVESDGVNGVLPKETFQEKGIQVELRKEDTKKRKLAKKVAKIKGSTVSTLKKEVVLIDDPLEPQDPKLNEIIVIEFENIEDVSAINDEVIKDPFVSFTIDEENNCVDFELNEAMADLTCKEESDINTKIFETEVECFFSESINEIAIRRGPINVDENFEENSSNNITDTNAGPELDEIENSTSTLQTVIVASCIDSVTEKYDAIANDKVEAQNMEVVSTEEEMIVAPASTESSVVDDLNNQDGRPTVPYDEANVNVAHLKPSNTSEILSTSDVVIKQELVEQQDVSALHDDSTITSAMLQSHVVDTTEEKECNPCGITVKNEGSGCLERISEDDRVVKESNTSLSKASTANFVKIQSHNDLNLMKIASDCLEDNDSSTDSEGDSIKDSVIDSLIKVDNEIQRMPHQYPAVPVEWRDYMKVFISNFYRNTDLLTDEVDTEEFKVILHDIKKHGAFPVLDIICNFFLDFIRQKNEMLEFGEDLTTEMETSLSLISSTIKAVLDCPLDCSQMHLKLISSILIELLTLPTPCRNQQEIIQSFLKVMLKHDPLLDWTKAYITETLQRMVQIPLRKLNEDTKCILGGAIELAYGLETIGMRCAGECGWETQILVLCRRYDKLKSKPKLYMDYLSENDTYIEHSIFLFLKTFCSQYSNLPMSYMFRIRTLVNEIYGEKMAMYSNAEVLYPINNGNNVVKEKARNSTNTHSKCNVSFKTDKLKSSTKLFSKRLIRPGKWKKCNIGNVMTLGVML